MHAKGAGVSRQKARVFTSDSGHKLALANVLALEPA